MNKPSRKVLTRCIYCPNAPDGEEHWLPQSLGVFEGNERLRGRVCTPCNVELGRTVDHVLAMTGPTALMRQVLGVGGKDDPNKRNVFDFKALQLEAPIQIFQGESLDDPVALQPFARNEDGTLKAAQRRTLTIRVGDTEKVMPFPKGWGEHQLRQAAEARGLLGGQVVRASAAPPETAQELLDASGEIIRAVFGRSVVDIYQTDLTQVPSSIEPTLVRFNISADYYRGVAKVAFHYLLWACPQVGGDEPEFSGIRGFVREGLGEVSTFVQADECRVDRKRPESGGTDSDCHMFAVAVTPDGIVGTVHFFSQLNGPSYPTFAVWMGQAPPILPMGWVRAHVAEFRKDVAGHAGRLSEMFTSPLPS